MITAGTWRAALLGAVLWVPSASWAIEGRVVDAAGSGVAGIGIYRIDQDADGGAASGSSRPLAVTDGAGQFAIDDARLAGDDGVILELREEARAEAGNATEAEAGSRRRRVGQGGRLRYRPENPPAALIIDYPVVEQIVLLHDNDQHFDFNMVEEFTRRVAAYRAEFDNVFLLNAGDVLVRRPERWQKDGQLFHGDKQWYRQQALSIIQTMNDIGYDVMTLGNHELAYVDGYTREALELARFPLLATNVEITTDALPEVHRSWVLRTDTGRTIGLIGLTLGAAPGVTILDRYQTAAEYERLKDEHDLVVGLTHIGYVADKALAERHGYLDVIIGGHSHTMLRQAELVNSVLVAQAGGNPHEASSQRPKHLGVIMLTLHNGQLVDKSGEVYTMPVPRQAAVP